MVAERELVVFDQSSPCPYLEGRTARLPHRYPAAKLSPAEFDRRLASGDRRSGPLLYRPNCPGCRACEPIRLDLTTFHPGQTQRRTFRRGEERLLTVIGPPQSDRQRVRLFNRHRAQRDLDRGEGPVDQADYIQFLVETCCDTWELAYYLDEQLVGVAIVDVGEQALSAVYCYYDPSVTAVSIGVYSVLRQVQLCRETGRRYLYLGYYIAGSAHMAYKARYHPHERLVDGQWREFA